MNLVLEETVTRKYFSPELKPGVAIEIKHKDYFFEDRAIKGITLNGIVSANHGDELKYSTTSGKYSIKAEGCGKDFDIRILK